MRDLISKITGDGTTLNITFNGQMQYGVLSWTTPAGGSASRVIHDLDELEQALTALAGSVPRRES